MDTGDKLSRYCEADETLLGGKARNRHSEKRARRITGTDGRDKTAVKGTGNSTLKKDTLGRKWAADRSLQAACRKLAGL